MATPSARLFEYEPAADRLTDRGDVVSQLRAAGIAREGESQMKIHSRIVQGEDGHLYFASMDEEGEKSDGGRLPTWGGHLWRFRLPENRWEHLLATREALIAVARGGRWTYSLGYFDHVVHQYDCRTGRTRSARIGAAGGHVSRNFLADHRGHVYVPRLARSEGGGMRTTLAELDPELRELGETPIGHYTQTTDDSSHGIVAFHPLADRSLVFATDRGFLYRVAPRDGGAAEVLALGWFHPKGESYAASLFSFEGERFLMGLSRRRDEYEWSVYDLSKRSSVALPVEIPAPAEGALSGLLLYGSVTRDDAGTCYLAGTGRRGGRAWPVVFRAMPPRHVSRPRTK